MSNPKGPKELLRLCTNLLELIEDTRAKSLSCNLVAKSVVQVLKLCTNVLFPLDRIGSTQQSIENTVEIECCLVSCMKICRNIYTETENHFGIFEENICRVELASVVGYLNLLIECSVQMEPIDPIEKMFGAVIPITTIVPNVVSKLFWLKHFNRETSVSWEIFSSAFKSEYGELKEYILNEFKKKLINREERVEIHQYGRFVERFSGPYEAFQMACDPGTHVICAGVVDDSNERAACKDPGIIKSLLGLNIIQVACGGQHAAVLTNEGQVYTWGRGGFGRLGHGNGVASEEPRLVESIRDLHTVQVACGFAYTAAVTREGALYTWGAGENGRLGLGDCIDRHSPCKVEALMDLRISGVSAGSVHTCMLTDRGEVFVCGKCEYTGHGEREDLLIPKILNAFDGVAVRQISVGPGGYHTIALTVRGDIYTWGHNRVGQLGYQNSETVPRNLEGAFFLPTPHVVSISGILSDSCEFRPTQVVAGWGHTSILLEDGRVLMCGRNYQGQLGLGDPSTFPTNERGHPFQPQFAAVAALNHKRVIQVACGGEHSVMLCEDNDMYTVGAGSRGQLGQGHLNGCTEPKISGPLKAQGRKLFQIACGNNCTLILAGKFQPQPLLRICAECVKRSPMAMERLLTSDVHLELLHEYVKNQDIPN